MDNAMQIIQRMMYKPPVDFSPQINQYATDTAQSYGNSFNRFRQGQFSPMEDTTNLIGLFPAGRVGAVGAKGAQAVSPQLLKQATKLLKGRITKDDVNVIGRFGEMVETGKGRNNLGETGQIIQSLVQNIFGSKSKDWNNQTVKNALDQVVKGAYGR
jgi:hypothetical protein